MTEEQLREILDDHMAVTTYDTRGRTYQGCPTCPPIAGVGLVEHPCSTHLLVEEVRRLNGWVEKLEGLLYDYDADWSMGL